MVVMYVCGSATSDTVCAGAFCFMKKLRARAFSAGDSIFAIVPNTITDEKFMENLQARPEPSLVMAASGPTTTNVACGFSAMARFRLLAASMVV